MDRFWTVVVAVAVLMFFVWLFERPINEAIFGDAPVKMSEDDRRADWERRRDDLLPRFDAFLRAEDFVSAARLLENYREVMDSETRGRHNFAMKQADVQREREAATAVRAADALAAEQRATEARIGPKPVPSVWNGTYGEVRDYLRERAHDPSSVELQECTYAVETPAGWVVSCTYRAKNLFGALVLDRGRFVVRHGRVVSTL
jgi:hypothetical protein